MIAALMFPTAKGLLGFLVGCVYANAFEYLYHRYPMHAWKSNPIWRRHVEHHRLVLMGAKDQQNRIALTWPVLTILGMHAAALIFVDKSLGTSLASSVIGGMVFYLVLIDVIHHWQHKGKTGKLPLLEKMRKYHVLHHEYPDTRFNIFLPLFDWLLGTSD